MISFLLNDTLCQIEEEQHARQTVLNYLRDNKKQCGTKEGCASGDCGACTVVVAAVENDSLKYETINSCIAPMSQLHAKQVITVEHLADGDRLHPVQQAMVDHHGSQCGFCTPGFVMSMFSLYKSRQVNTDIPLSRHTVNEQLGGNLCRCTGYRPIIDAALESCHSPEPDKFDHTSLLIKQRLLALQDVNEDYLPRTEQALANALKKYPDAKLVSGGTDLMLAVTQQHQDLGHTINLSSIASLQTLDVTDTHLIIGAGVTLTRLLPELEAHFPPLAELLTRFASQQIRNVATIGGNIANASPIGDLAPALLALDAHVVVKDTKLNERSIPIRTFFEGYKKTQLHQNEWLHRFELPLLNSNQIFDVYKVSKRFEDDISAVCAAFMVEIDDNKIVKINTGFGGVAATPAMATVFERVLTHKTWLDKATLDEGISALNQAFTPLTDVRASAEYRQHLVTSLWTRFWTLSTSDVVVMLDHSEVTDA
ncbi:xanthine dehydrogenase small subunit [Aestuariibacter sp. AA17]|uniref:Xanthine dehydrogenase small subunit n=1 Tax=Fluctibacter corallii TaxID=2984329 RepID=A0ABT3A6F2_9ALTE|nr:xanthine dehydrogenase small subunit [Aestuariibacter sp. AA17]MCV2884228.1 xanthine dehydrogenase small subunit [Aestuariibacter sp. AA17]